MTGVTDIRGMKARIIVLGVGGAGGNAVNNMIASGLQGVEFIVANTDAQALTTSRAKRIIQMGAEVTQGLGAGSQPEVGRAAAEEATDALSDHLTGAHMVFVTAGMGGGTGTGAAPVIANAARELGILTIGVVTKPFHFEGQRRMRLAEAGIAELLKAVDTLLVIPNQNLFRVAKEKTTFADAFALTDQVLHSCVACISDLIVKEGLINLDFADVRTVMCEKGKAMMGRGEASGAKRALDAAEAAISNPLIEDPSIKRASGLIISISGGKDLRLFEVEEAATRIREEVDEDANIIVGATFDESLEGIVRVSVVATGIDNLGATRETQPAPSPMELAGGLRNESSGNAERTERSAPRPQLSGDAPGFFRMTKEALLGLEKGLRAQCEQPALTSAPETEGATEGDRHRHRVAIRRQSVRAPWQ
jgi:cell division protein FtsZ